MGRHEKVRGSRDGFEGMGTTPEGGTRVFEAGVTGRPWDSDRRGAGNAPPNYQTKEARITRPASHLKWPDGETGRGKDEARAFLPLEGRVAPKARGRVPSLGEAQRLHFRIAPARAAAAGPSLRKAI